MRFFGDRGDMTGAKGQQGDLGRTVDSPTEHAGHADAGTDVEIGPVDPVQAASVTGVNVVVGPEASADRNAPLSAVGVPGQHQINLAGAKFVDRGRVMRHQNRRPVGGKTGQGGKRIAGGVFDLLESGQLEGSEFTRTVVTSLLSMRTPRSSSSGPSCGES